VSCISFTSLSFLASAHDHLPIARCLLFYYGTCIVHRSYWHPLSNLYIVLHAACKWSRYLLKILFREKPTFTKTPYQLHYPYFSQPRCYLSPPRQLPQRSFPQTINQAITIQSTSEISSKMEDIKSSENLDMDLSPPFGSLTITSKLHLHFEARALFSPSPSYT
jgi:hypothetical protein